MNLPFLIIRLELKRRDIGYEMNGNREGSLTISWRGVTNGTKWKRSKQKRVRNVVAEELNKKKSKKKQHDNKQLRKGSKELKKKRKRRRVIGRSDLLTDGMSSMCPLATSKRHRENMARNAHKGIVLMEKERGTMKIYTAKEWQK